MLSIRMQRLGRKGHPVYRVVVQDSRQAPTSGKYIALLGSYDPHTKATTLNKEKAEFYLTNGAQPSDTVVRLFTTEKVKLPNWVVKPVKQKRDTRNPEKLRRNQPADKPAAEEASTEETAPAEEAKAADAETAEQPVAEEPAEEAVQAEVEADSEKGADKTESEPAQKDSEEKSETKEEKTA